jgi:hypothetical protein
MSLASSNPLFLALRQLYDAGRLTGVTPDLAIDGHRLLAAEDFNIDPLDEISWREDGFSAQQSEWGGRMSRAVEAHRAALLANGSSEDDAAARELPQWFVAVDDTMDERAEYMARENHQYVYMIRAFAGFRPQRYVATMQEYSPRFLNKQTGEPDYSYTTPMNQRTHNPGGANPGAPIPNHRILVGEGWTNELLGQWATDWTTRVTRGEVIPESIG